MAPIQTIGISHRVVLCARAITCARSERQGGAIYVGHGNLIPRGDGGAELQAPDAMERGAAARQIEGNVCKAEPGGCGSDAGARLH
jgi:hypothetical protein